VFPGPVRKVDNLPPSCAVVTKSGNLNYLEPSGPVTGLLCLLQSMKTKDGGAEVHQYSFVLTMYKVKCEAV